MLPLYCTLLKFCTVKDSTKTIFSREKVMALEKPPVFHILFKADINLLEHLVKLIFILYLEKKYI